MNVRAILQFLRDSFPAYLKRRVVWWLSLALVLCLAGCNEKKKDLSPPPLNPHPKEAVHIRVSFDNPEDAKRYTVSMRAHYQNQQRECGYIASWWVGNFVYPEGEFDIPNEGREPDYSDFTIYLDRYNRETCNWEFVGPNVQVTDRFTRRIGLVDFGPDEDMTPGTIFKATCQFMANDYPQTCSGRRPPPDVPHYSRVPITIHVSDDSAPLRPKPPGFFSNFLEPMNPAEATSATLRNNSR